MLSFYIYFKLHVVPSGPRPTVAPLHRYRNLLHIKNGAMWAPEEPDAPEGEEAEGGIPRHWRICDLGCGQGWPSFCSIAFFV